MTRGQTGGVEGSLKWRPLMSRVALDLDRSVTAVELTREVEVMFQGPECRQYLRPGPLIVPKRGPFVEVGGLPAGEELAVDRAGPTEPLASRKPRDVLPRVGAGGKPIPLRVVSGAEVAGRAVVAAFEQQNFHRRVLAEACRDDAAGRAGSDHGHVRVMLRRWCHPARRLGQHVHFASA